VNFFNKLDKPYFLAEIGVNHNGSLAKAKKLIESAKKCGASGVKFQTFSAKNLAETSTPKVKYQVETTGNKETHFQMLEKLELSFDEQVQLNKYCKKLKIDFISTPYDIESAKFLNKLKVPFFKTASADLVDVELHEYIASKNAPVVISVGMATYNEIQKTLNIYKGKNKNIILLHCVSNYPCSDISLNLNVIKTLKNKYKFPVGFSDHSKGSEAAIAATALGAFFFEKHITLNKKDKGPDHKASSSIKEFKDLVRSVKRAHTMMGIAVKKVQIEEMEMLAVSRKSIRYDIDLNKGTILNKNNLIFKRPGDGINPQRVKMILGKKLKRSVKAGQKVRLSDCLK
tara:strand:- start:442 stop:1470 length:1029 start_codon:yes stop_codon:yes gene_type:complete